MFQQNPANPTAMKLTIRLSFSFICVLLLIVIAVMLFLWKPWSNVVSSARKISVTGQATIKSEPDEYQLSPYFEFDSADRTKNTTDASTMGQHITAKLKELGVKE